MAYKKYIKRGGKLFGPYYYESYRDADGKVKKRYVGTTGPDEGKSRRSFFGFGKLFGFSLILLLAVLIIFGGVRGITANVVSNVVGEIVVSSFDGATVDLEIKDPEVIGGEVLGENKNKRMDFALSEGSLRLYFDLVNYSEIVESVEDIVDADDESLISMTGNFIRGLTGFVVGDNESFGKEEFKVADEEKVKKVKEKIEELGIEEVSSIVEDAVVEVEDFNISVEANDSEYKWGYHLKLNDLNFMAKVEVSSTENISMWNNYTLRVGNSLISFEDLIAEGYSVRIERPSLGIEFEVENVSEVMNITNESLVGINETIDNESVVGNETIVLGNVSLENETIEGNESVSVGNVSEVLMLPQVPSGEGNESLVGGSETLENESVVDDENESVVGEISSGEEVVVEELPVEEELVEELLVEEESVEEVVEESSVEEVAEEVVEESPVEEESEGESVPITANLIRALTGWVVGEADDLIYSNSISVYIERDFTNSSYSVGDMVYLDPTLVDSYAVPDATRDSNNENIVWDSNGVLHAAYVASGDDLWYANSSDGGVTWSAKELVATTVVQAGILVDSSDKIIVYYDYQGGLYMLNSSDSGVSWSSVYSPVQSTVFKPSCAMGNDDVIHCSYITSGDLLNYTNSTDWSKRFVVNNNIYDDTDYTDIAVASNGCVYVTGVGSDQDDTDIWSPCLNGWGDSNRVEVFSGIYSELGSIPSITIDNEDNIYVVNTDISDLWFANSSDGGVTWSSQEIDASASYHSDIGVSASGDIYITYTDVAVSSILSTNKIYLANSSDGGVTWSVRNLLQSSAGFASIADSLFPESNRMKEVFGYGYTTSSGDFYYDNFSIPYVPYSNLSIEFVNLTGAITMDQYNNYEVSVNVTCHGDIVCGFVNVTLDPIPINELSEDISDSSIVGGVKNLWNINKSGAEENLNIRYEEINETATEFCVGFVNNSAYKEALLEEGRDISRVPISSGSSGFEYKEIDLSILEEDEEYCFIVGYEEFVDEMIFKIGWESVLVEALGSIYGTLYTQSESLVRAPNGDLYVTYIGDSEDLFFGNSSDEGVTWDVQEIADAVTARNAGIVVDSSGEIFVYYSEGDIIMYNSSDGGLSWSSQIIGDMEESLTYPACVVDGNDIIHCSFIDSGSYLYYINSSAWNTEIPVNVNSADDTDYADIEVDSNNCVYIIGTGSDQDDLDIWSPCLNGWGDSNRVEINDGATVSTYYLISLAIDDEDNIYAAFIDGIDLWFANSSDGGVTWSSKEIDGDSSYFPDIGVSAGGDIYILYKDVGLASISSSDEVYMSNSSDGGETWDVRTELELSSGGGSIGDSVYPSSNRITDMFRYVYTDSSGGIFYDNFSISSTVDSHLISKDGLIPEDGGLHFYINTSLSENGNPANCTLGAGESCIVNWTVYVNGSIGNIYEFFANATANVNYSTSGTSIINVTIADSSPDTTVPNVTEIGPTNLTITGNTSINFTANFTDDTGLANATLYIYNSTGGLYNSTFVSIIGAPLAYVTGIVVDLVEGVYSWFWEVFDLAGNMMSSSNESSGVGGNYSLTLDLSNSSVVINSPLNLNYTTSNILFNVTATDVGSVDSCWVSIDSGVTNNTLVQDGSSDNYNWTGSVSEGQYVAEFWCNDSLGNVNGSESVSFGVVEGEVRGLGLDDLLWNVSVEGNGTTNNFTHLSVSDLSPYNHLVGYWSFDGDKENTALSTAYDWSGSGNDGTMVGNAVVNSSGGRYGEGLVLDGAGDYVDVGNDESLLESSGDNTICLWYFTRSNTSSQGLVSDWVAGYNYWYTDLHLKNTGYYQYGCTNDTAAFSSNSIAKHPTNQWTQICFLMNDSGNYLFQNGEFFESSLGKDCTFAKPNDKLVRIGTYYGTGETFNGSIDEVMIFNTSLTADQIQEIYNNQSARFKPTGTQKVRAVNIQQDGSYNNINLSTTVEENEGSRIEARVGMINSSVNTSGLVLYMPFEWGSAVDISGQGNDGTIVNAVWNSSGGVNETGGFAFDGDGDAVQVSDGSKLNPNKITLSAWMKPSDISSTRKTLFDDSYLLTYDSDKLTWWARNNLAFRYSDSFSQLPNEWTHIVVVHDYNLSSNSTQFYIKGELLTNTTTATGPLGTGNFQIGKYSTNTWSFNGSIDEVMIFNRSLSATEIQTLYNESIAKHNIPYYSDYQNISSGENVSFDISTSADFVFPDYKFWTGNSSSAFYSPLVLGSSSLFSFADSGSAGGCDCSSLQSGSAFDCSSSCLIEACDVGGVLGSTGSGEVWVTGDLTGISGFNLSSGCVVNVADGVSVSF